MNTARPISFLMGSGFSKPAGYPLASEINARFWHLKESDISIHTDGTAWFNEGSPTPNDWWMRKDERLFIERLVGYYCTVVGSFHYESFYDWYKHIENGEEAPPEVVRIAKDLKRQLPSAMLEFDLSFNQLLAQLLRRWYPSVHLRRGLPQSHATFLDFVAELSRDFTLHFHTLNHDLFFESLSSTDAMRGELADGFSDSGSCYYGEFADVVPTDKGDDFYSYRVRLPRFVDKFGSSFNLYKLHGSVDQYVDWKGSATTFKGKRGIGATRFYRETSENGESSYESLAGIYHPDFLAGTSYKTSRYGSTPYYRAVFEHLRKNLSTSATLVVIGYGFGDDEINRMISEHFLSKERARIFVVDVERPELPSDFNSAVDYFGGGVSDFDRQSLFGAIAENEK